MHFRHESCLPKFDRLCPIQNIVVPVPLSAWEADFERVWNGTILHIACWRAVFSFEL